MEAWQIILSGFSCIGAAACSFCAWYMKKIVTDIEQIKITLAVHSEQLKKINQYESTI